MGHYASEMQCSKCCGLRFCKCPQKKEKIEYFVNEAENKFTVLSTEETSPLYYWNKPRYKTREAAKSSINGLIREKIKELKAEITLWENQLTN